MSERLPRGEVVLYATDDGRASFHLRAIDGTVWLTQGELAVLFETTKQNVSLHVRNVLEEGELLADSVVKQDLTTAADGKHYRTLVYNLDMILAIGYRVKSVRGTQFRQWATTNLREYLVKGFVMDDERLKDPAGQDYFDELLERIRDIRSSEKRFYQKVRDLFALSVDYADDAQATGFFFAEVQNKMFFAVTGRTAAELIVDRADPDQPNMGLASWKSDRLRKGDTFIAKNYLNAKELTDLNRIVSLFLDFAELRARQRQNLQMADWRTYVDSFMTFNEQPLLQGNGRMSQASMSTIISERYETFDAIRRGVEARKADDEDWRELEDIEKQLSRRKNPENNDAQ